MKVKGIPYRHTWPDFKDSDLEVGDTILMPWDYDALVAIDPRYRHSLACDGFWLHQTKEDVGLNKHVVLIRAMPKRKPGQNQTEWYNSAKLPAESDNKNVPSTNKLACIGRIDACDPGCPGWAIFNEDPLDVSRCDDCARFENDGEAIRHIAGCDECALRYGKEVIALNVELSNL
jgi:hypothetical protein